MLINMRLWFGLVCFALIVAVASADGHSPAGQANNLFSFDLLQTLTKGDANSKQQNIFFSPYSISAALAMTSLGAKGNTLKQIDQTFHLNALNSQNPMAVHEAYETLTNAYNGATPSYELTTANRLFGGNNYAINQSFQSNAKRYYKAEMEQVDFGSGNAEGIINKWVENKTHDKIKNLFAPSSFDKNTKLVLVNALYFKGSWKTPFKKQSTRMELFHLDNTNQKQVSMMQLDGPFKYVHDGKMKAIELPYKGDRLAMIIVLPDDVEGLPKVIEDISGGKLHSLMMKTNRTYVDVQLPKFKLETTYALKTFLQQLGLHDLFTNGADLSGINKDLKVDAVVHKAFVEVDEEGTEAAAATGVKFEGRLAMMTPNDHFVADHPFYFAIVDKKLHTILFNGIFNQP